MFFERYVYWGIVQLVEHRILIPGVVGSSPATPAKNCSPAIGQKEVGVSPTIIIGDQTCWRGGIGRRWGLKIPWASARVGSSPTASTNKKVKIILDSKDDNNYIYYVL